MTFFLSGLTVSRAMTRDPMAAWMATSNICRGISFCIFSTSDLPRVNAESRWRMSDSASTVSPFTRTSSFTSGDVQCPVNW